MKKKKKYVNRFRGRLIFPINDISGNPIAIGGRSIVDNSFYAKYINSPETLFFKKGSLLKEKEVNLIVDVIVSWLEDQIAE